MLIVTDAHGSMTGFVFDNVKYYVYDTVLRYTYKKFGSEIIEDIKCGTKYVNVGQSAVVGYALEEVLCTCAFLDFNEDCCFRYTGGILHVYTGGLYYRIPCGWDGSSSMHGDSNGVRFRLSLGYGYIGEALFSYKDAPTELYIGTKVIQGVHCSKVEFMRYVL